MALKVYVSYAWEAEEDSGVVAALETALAGQGIELVRDVRRVGYGESIRGFMDEIGAADQVVLVLSEAYFRSPYCLYELRAVAEHRDFRRRVHPVVLAGCGINDPLWWIDIVAHWEEQGRVLEAKLENIGRANIGPLNRALDEYADFRRLVAFTAQYYQRSVGEVGLAALPPHHHHHADARISMQSLLVNLKKRKPEDEPSTPRKRIAAPTLKPE